MGGVEAAGGKNTSSSSEAARVEQTAATPMLTTDMLECQSTLGERLDFRARLASLHDEGIIVRIRE